MNESAVEQRLDDVHDRLVYHTVFHNRLVNRSLLWIVNREWFIRAVAIRTRNQLFVDFKKVVFQVALEYHDVIPRAFAGAEKLPSQK